jgi:hypothetical protein
MRISVDNEYRVILLAIDHDNFTELMKSFSWMGL